MPYGRMQEDPKIGSVGAPPLGMGRASPRKRPDRNVPPHVCYRAEFGRSRWNRVDIRLPRSLKVIGTDTDRSATYDFLLVIYGPAIFEIKGDFSWKSQRFFSYSQTCITSSNNQVQVKSKSKSSSCKSKSKSNPLIAVCTSSKKKSIQCK